MINVKWFLRLVWATHKNDIDSLVTHVVNHLKLSASEIWGIVCRIYLGEAFIRKLDAFIKYAITFAHPSKLINYARIALFTVQTHSFDQTTEGKFTKAHLG